MAAQEASGARLALEGTIVVGADGFRSVVAQETQAPFVRHGTSASAMLYRYVEGLPGDGYEWAYGDGSAAGLLPTNGGATCVFVATTPQRMRRLRRSGRERAFATLLTSAAPGLVERVNDTSAWTTLTGWAGLPGYARQSWGPGWALVGDAGYFKDPITTHGMTDALRDAELLSDRILDVLGGAPEGVALPAYQRTRDRLSASLFDATEQVARYDWDCVQARALLRTVSSAMSDEVDHLQALPDRRVDPGIAAFIPTDNFGRAG